MDDQGLSIREVAEQTGVSLHTLRYYERIGLLDPIERTTSGHRRFQSHDIRRIEFLKRLRATGMPISKMQHYVELFRMGDRTAVERREMLVQHRQAVLSQIDALGETLQMLETKIDNYDRQLATMEEEA
ncbi:MAG: MerR family transcriptional regulator [Chloroflexi bacterium]|nr:MerR family transcriptional regulator [Chloroflexota bacterium]